MPVDVLIVDDSAAIRKILQRMLKQAGLDVGIVLEAGDGVEALEKLSGHLVGLILSDINMPNMDGIQLLATLKSRAEFRHIPIVMITTEGGEAKVMQALQLGANGYVRKPFTADQIKEKLLGYFSSP
jgi:two-component system chemotaxis response regulator CheY